MENPFYNYPVKEIIKALRAISPTVDENPPCLICDKHGVITEQHHIIPVSVMARSLQRMPFIPGKPPIRTVWLCPNHHAYWHLVVRTIKNGKPIKCLRDLDEDELQFLYDLSLMYDIAQVEFEAYKEYTE